MPPAPTRPAPAGRWTCRASPSAPDVGFYGRDETLLSLDRAFDTDPVVLLRAFAGPGKTTTAVEFARWYATTGGLDHPASGMTGPPLWTSFEHHTPLARVLDTAAAAFAPLLQANGIEWPALTDPAVRRQLVVQLLTLVPVLWMWDNVEPVTGFPPDPQPLDPHRTGRPGRFPARRRQHEAKVLLTSRRDEQGWLGTLPVRVALPRMPIRERRRHPRPGRSPDR